MLTSREKKICQLTVLYLQVLLQNYDLPAN
jgi:hypothetical protein